MSRTIRGWTAALALAAVLLPAAAGAQSALAPGFSKLPEGATVVVVPPDVELFNISAGGVLEPQAEWTSSALAHMRKAFLERKSALKVQFREMQDDADETIDALNRLHGAVGNAIALHQFGPFKLPTKEGRMEWTLGPDARAIREKTGASFALFSFVRDSYASAERKAAIVVAALLGVGLGGGAQVGYASLVNLETGDVIWFNRLLRGSGDLREAEAAHESVQALLAGFPE